MLPLDEVIAAMTSADRAYLEGAAAAFGLMGMAAEIAAWPCVNGEHWWQGDVCAECGKRYEASPIRSKGDLG